MALWTLMSFDLCANQQRINAGYHEITLKTACCWPNFSKRKYNDNQKLRQNKAPPQTNKQTNKNKKLHQHKKNLSWSQSR